MTTLNEIKFSTDTNTVVFMMGSLGAGKSYMAKKLFPDTSRLDCDEIKKEHPDYDPKNPGLVHEWSSVKMNKLVNRNMAFNDMNFIVDGTGVNSEKMVMWMSKAKLRGMKTALVFVTTKLQTALERNEKRERTVPVDMLIDKYEAVNYSFELVAPHADQVMVVEN